MCDGDQHDTHTNMLSMLKAEGVYYLAHMEFHLLSNNCNLIVSVMQV